MNTFAAINEIITREIAGIDLNKQPEGLYAPVVYTLSLGGKRIRPALVLMATDMFGGDIHQAVGPALGIEVFHNFTLLHDDIMDKAPIRRGRPTVHVQWNDNSAILSGDLMQILAYQLVAKAPVAHLPEILNLFSQTAAEVCEGQQYDMDFEDRSQVEADEYLEMIRLKTAVLLACSLKTGAIIGGASAKDAQLLYDFGIHIGLAFQLKDDLLDVYGDEKTFGKKIGGDILCNKKTYLLIHALKLTVGEDAQALQKWLQTTEIDDPQQKIDSVTGIYNRSGVRTICEDKMLSYYEKAIADLKQIDVPEENKRELLQLAAKLMDRKD